MCIYNVEEAIFIYLLIPNKFYLWEKTWSVSVSIILEKILHFFEEQLEWKIKSLICVYCYRKEANLLEVRFEEGAIRFET